MPSLRVTASAGVASLRDVTGADVAFVDSLANYLALHLGYVRPTSRPDLVHVMSVTSGSVALVVGEKHQPLNAGELVVVPPAVRFGVTDGSAAEGIVVAVPAVVARDIASTSDVMKLCLDADHAIVLRGVDQAAIHAHASALSDALGQVTATAKMAVFAALYSVFDALAATLLAQGIDGAATEDPATRVADAFIDLIEKHYRSQRPLTAYCDELGITERALRRATHRVHGQTPLQMVHMRTVIEAKRLLRFTQISVADIGAALGFDDPAYFNRFFKKSVGESPRAWRVWQIGA
ncbi:MAG: AraC family transcriptional regulator [Pseudomonadota bacterium]